MDDDVLVQREMMGRRFGCEADHTLVGEAQVVRVDVSESELVRRGTVVPMLTGVFVPA